MELSDFKPGDRVKYVPYHAHGNRQHMDCEDGEVSSVNSTYVFVRFVKQGLMQRTGQACLPNQLVK